MKANSLEKELIKESILIIGRVHSVEGRIVTVKVNKNKNHSHIVYEGKVIKNVSVGSYIKITKGFINIIGKVESESIQEERVYNSEYGRDNLRIDRTLKVSLFGHFDNGYFKQGVKEMPLIDNECYLLDIEEFNSLHKFYRLNSKTISVGSLSDEPSQEIRLSVNKIFASHIGIFGNTGSGKSNTLAKIFTELFNECGQNSEFQNNSRFIIIDFNGEYVGDQIITTKKNAYKLSTREESGKFPISIDNIKKLEILSVLLEATEKTQTPFLSRAIRIDSRNDIDNYQNYIIERLENIFKDIVKKSDRDLRLNIFTELLGHIKSIVENQDKYTEVFNKIENNLTWHSVSNCYVYSMETNIIYSNSDPQNLIVNALKNLFSTLIFKTDEFSKIKLGIIIHYYHEIVKGYANQEHIKPLIGRMFKKFQMLEKLIEIKTDGSSFNNNLIVVSLRDVNLEMKKIMPLLICKQMYDEKRVEENRKKSLHIVVDEAHNILSTMSQRESETWKDYRLETFEEIIKEGRKFGTFLTIASQRPYDISPTIISQLHNYFIHRLINENDIQAISKTVAYLDKLSFQTIPILPVGTCFIAGLASDIPVKVDIKLLERDQQPESETIDLEALWKDAEAIF